MKKIICTLMIVAFLTSLFASCGNDIGPDLNEKLPTADEIKLEYFTAVANSKSFSDAVTVTVCEQYRDTLGEKVTVKMPGLDTMEIEKDSEIRVAVDKFADEDGITVYAKNVQVISFEIEPSIIQSIPAKEFGITKFTCEANGVSMGNAVYVTVDNEANNTELLGKTVNVSMTGIYSLDIWDGDRLEITVNSVTKTLPITVYASDIKVIERGEAHKNNDQIDGYGIGPFTVPDFSKLYVPDDFTDPSDLISFYEESNGDFTKEEVEAIEYYFFQNQWYSYGDILRVVEIKDDRVYLADVSDKDANYLIIGVPNASFSIGDHVRVEVTEYFCAKKNFKYNIAFSRYIKTFEALDFEKYKSAYYTAYSVEKPVIYLYPEEDTLCSVKVDLDGKLTCTYPDHGNDGWQNFVARPDGTLVFPDGKEYYCLYWEGVANMTPDFSKGFCVKGADTAEFLSDILLEIGLTPREANEFIIYWLPILQENEYNLISFQRDAYTDIADLIIDPAPDSLLRVYMVAKPLDSFTKIEPQVFDGFVRDGFTVVEWGGSIIQ